MGKPPTFFMLRESQPALDRTCDVRPCTCSPAFFASFFAAFFLGDFNKKNSYLMGFNGIYSDL